MYIFKKLISTFKAIVISNFTAPDFTLIACKYINTYIQYILPCTIPITRTLFLVAIIILKFAMSFCYCY